MAVNVKDIETLWNQYSEDGVKKGISVAHFLSRTVSPTVRLRNGTRKGSLVRILLTVS